MLKAVIACVKTILKYQIDKMIMSCTMNESLLFLLVLNIITKRQIVFWRPSFVIESDQEKAQQK